MHFTSIFFIFYQNCVIVPDYYWLLKVFFLEGTNWFNIIHLSLPEFPYDIILNMLCFEFDFYFHLIIWKIILFFFIIYVLYYVLSLIRLRLDVSQDVFILSQLNRVFFFLLIFLLFVFGGNFWWIPFFVLFILKTFYIEGSFFYGDFLNFSVRFLLIYFIMSVIILKIYYWFWVYFVYCLFFYLFKRMHKELLEAPVAEAFAVYYEDQKEDDYKTFVNDDDGEIIDINYYLSFYPNGFSKDYAYVDLIDAVIYGKEKVINSSSAFLNELELDTAIKESSSEVNSNPFTERIYQYYQYEQFRRESAHEKDFFA